MEMNKKRDRTAQDGLKQNKKKQQTNWFDQIWNYGSMQYNVEILEKQLS